MAIPEGYLQDSYQQYIKDINDYYDTDTALHEYAECNKSIAEAQDRKERGEIPLHDVRVYAAQLIREAFSAAYHRIEDIEDISIRDAVRISGAIYDIEQIVDHMMQAFYDKEV